MVEVKKAAVIGAGFMGSSIAFLCAQKEIDVYNVDVLEKQIDLAKEEVEKLIARLIKKQEINSEKADQIRRNLHYSTDYRNISEAQIVIEAVSEKQALKVDVISKIEKVTKESTIILSNTSGLSISEMAKGAKRPDKIMCAHFFSPAVLMKLVELVRGEKTSDETYEKTKDFIGQIDKVSVNAPEMPGFIVNRLLIPMINNAAYLLMQGACKEDIDQAMKLGANHKMGPLELGDYIGLDVVLAIMQTLHDGLKDDQYTPCPIIEDLVSKGKLGRKTKNGFYQY